MLDLDAELRWSPRARVVAVPGGGVALLGPTHDFVLSAEQLGPWVPSPGGRVVPRDRLRPGTDPIEGARELVRLEGLVEAGLLVPAAARDDGEGEGHDGRSWAARLGWPADVAVVLAARGPEGGVVPVEPPPAESGWVLVAPAGERPLVGPFFDAREAERPCWGCVDALLVRNRPLRRWLRHHEGSWGPPSPATPAEAEAVLRAMAARPSLLDALRASPVLFSLGGAAPSWAPHVVHKLPRCPRCGAPIEASAGRPLVLRAVVVRAHDDDGGWRERAPGPTGASLRRWVDPLTGLFRAVEPLHRSAEGMAVHRASFGVCPLDRPVVDGEAFVEVALGKGLTQAQSMASALGEATERIAACYRGDEAIVVGTPADLPGPAVEPAALVPLSEAQYRAFEAEAADHPHAVLRYPASAPIEWVPAWSLRDQAVRYVPASYCYAHGPLAAARYCRFTSNGGAAGAAVEEAIVQGLFEVIERDAVSIWWYARTPRPAIARADWWRPEAERLEATLGPAWDSWALDLTHDLGLPVVAAVARHREHGRAGFGFGCHVDPRLALRRALTELGQLVVAGQAHARAFDLDGVRWEPHLLPGAGRASAGFDAPPPCEEVDLRAVILECVGRAARLGLDVLVHRYDRPELPLQVVKVIVPGLGHVWPRLGCRRLFDVPVALGWLERPRREDELQPLALWL